MEQYLRKDLLSFKAYKPQEQRVKRKLDANESPFPLPEKVLEEFCQYLKGDYEPNRYPNTNSDGLRQVLSQEYKVAEENVIVGVGSDQLIDYVCRAFLEPGDKVVVPSPSFSMYTITAELNHGKVVECPLEEDFEYSIDKFIGTIIEHDPKIVILCSPNNPTGNRLSNEAISLIASQTKGILLVDEAYGDFAKETALDILNEHANMIVLRTLSKAMGVASIRVGYGIAGKEMISCLEKVKAPYNINDLSQKLAIFLLKNKKRRMKEIDYLIDERIYLAKKLESIGLKVYPSEANFILVEVKDKDISNQLLGKGILVRGFTHPQLKDCLRVSIGNREDNDAVIRVMSDSFRKGG